MAGSTMEWLKPSFTEKTCVTFTNQDSIRRKVPKSVQSIYLIVWVFVLAALWWRVYDADTTMQSLRAMRNLEFAFPAGFLIGALGVWERR
jgi:hypothetical protein